MASETLPPLPEHVFPSESMPRSGIELDACISYCRRCGRLIAKDSDPSWKQKKPCEQVRVGFRAADQDGGKGDL